MKLAVDLKRLGLTPGEAVVGVGVLSHLNDLGIEPGEIRLWASACRDLTSSEQEAKTFARAALALHHVRERTGLEPEDLEHKVLGLEEEAARLEPVVRERKKLAGETKELDERRRSLSEEVTRLDKRGEVLNRSIAQKEQRDAQLSTHVKQLEQRAQDADERLATARRDLRQLAELGLSVEELTGFVERLAGVAQRHDATPERLREWLLHELENLDSSVSLEAQATEKREELTAVKQEMRKARREKASVESQVQQLHEEHDNLKAVVGEEWKRLVAGAKQELADGVQAALQQLGFLRDGALEVGRDLGRFEGITESNEWLQTLVDLHNADGSVSAAKVRVIGIAILRSITTWLGGRSAEVASSSMLKMSLEAAVRELEGWKT